MASFSEFVTQQNAQRDADWGPDDFKSIHWEIRTRDLLEAIVWRSTNENDLLNFALDKDLIKSLYSTYLENWRSGSLNLFEAGVQTGKAMASGDWKQAATIAMESGYGLDSDDLDTFNNGAIQGFKGTRTGRLAALLLVVSRRMNKSFQLLDTKKKADKHWN